MEAIAQGEVYITLIDSVPAGAVPVQPQGGRYVLGHSETGHHHVVSAETTKVLTPPPTEAIPTGISQLYMIVKAPTQVVHLRRDDTHAPQTLEPGIYRVRRARERDPLAALRGRGSFDGSLPVGGLAPGLYRGVLD
jgi:hypothetical protein